MFYLLQNEQLKNELIKRQQQYSLIANLLQRKQDENEILLRDIDILKA